MRPTPFLPLLLALGAATVEAAEPGATLSGPASAPIAVVRLAGSEAISALYRYEVELAGAPVAFETLLGKEVTVTLPVPGGKVRHLSGICSRFSQGAVQRLEIVPEFWLLTRRMQSRMFQDLSVPEILARVLGDAGIPHRALLAGDFPKRDCVVQYNETDFVFLSRLMEEEGIFYFFTHGASGHELVIANSPQGHPDLPSGATVKWLGPRPGHGVHEWNKVQELRSGKTTLRDHVFQYPDDPFEVSALLQESVAAGRVTHRLRVEGSEALELYDFPGDYAARFDGVDDDPSHDDIASEAQRTVSIRIQEEAAQALVIEGAGVLGQLVAGHRFTLAGHPDADGRYVLTGVQHTATALPGRRGVDWQTSFTCIPEALAYRPERTTPRPLAGVETAVVTGPAGAAIHTDKYGRVKVQFHWDRQGARDENASCWIRVGALHAGQEDGWTLVPEVGDEVVVAFEHGDPDRPIVIGSVYNAHRPPPAPPR